jgi:hypothetical protein
VAWEFVLAVVSAVGSIIGSVQVIKMVVRREQRNCDQRLEAFKAGLAEGRRDK